MTYNISTQSYVNGVYNDKLYVFDKSEMVQYEINPATEEVKVVGDVNNKAFAYINGKREEVSVYDMAKEEIIFTEKEDIYEENNCEKIYATKKYAICYLNGDFYKIYAKYPNNKILLLNAPNAKEIRLRNDYLYYIIDDSIYRYNDHGSVILATKKEIKFNSDNVFDIYFE
jgi:hypothetical protein